MGTGTWRDRLGRDRAPGALWRVVAFAVLFLAILQLQVVLLPGIEPLYADDLLTIGLVVQGLMLLVAALAAGAVLLRWADARPMRELGFAPAGGVPRELGAGLLIGAGCLVAVVVPLALTGAFHFDAEPGTAAGWAGVVVTSMLWLAVPAAAEEALFRGYPFRALVDGMGPVAALLVTSALFAAVHGANPNVDPLGLLNIFFAGLLLGYAVLRTGSLWLATGVHLGWNWAIAGLLDLPVSGLDPFDPPLYDLEPGAPAWLSGGAFGPEGGVAASLAIALGLVLTWKLTGSGRALAAPNGQGDGADDADR